MKIKVAPMKESDVNEIKKLETQCQLSPWPLDDYIKEINRNDSITLTLKRKDNLIGFLIARLITSEGQYLKSQTGNHLKRDAEIYNIAVKPGFRNRNLGTILLSHFFEFAKQYNLSETFLEVRKSNVPAIEFYKKNHFEIIGTRANFYSNPVEDALIMCRRLDL